MRSLKLARPTTAGTRPSYRVSMTCNQRGSSALAAALSERDATMDDIDLLSINTIRTLSIDAVQKANSGHPGAPMGLAPVAYTLWQDYLRYDPSHPLWPNRDRFVLSAGHASMLLYSMLHLTKVQAVGRGRRAAEPPGGQHGRHQELPPARQRLPRSSGIPLHDRRRGHHRPARPGRVDERRHGDRREVARSPLQHSPDHDPHRLQHLCDLQRRRDDGGRRQRGRLAGRPPQARQPLLALRFQQDHARRARRPGPSARTWRPASWPMAGTCCTCATPTTSSESSARIDAFLQREVAARR